MVGVTVGVGDVDVGVGVTDVWVGVAVIVRVGVGVLVAPVSQIKHEIQGPLTTEAYCANGSVYPALIV